MIAFKDSVLMEWIGSCSSFLVHWVACTEWPKHLDIVQPSVLALWKLDQPDTSANQVPQPKGWYVEYKSCQTRKEVSDTEEE
jgi:hypothetical protein